MLKTYNCPNDENENVIRLYKATVAKQTSFDINVTVNAQPSVSSQW